MAETTDAPLPGEGHSIESAVAALQESRKKQQQEAPAEAQEAAPEQPEQETPPQDWKESEGEPSEAEESKAEEQEAEEETQEQDNESEEAETLEQEEPEAKTLAVDIEGEQVEVTLEDLKKGYLRQKDYSRKTQSLADERRVFEQNVQDYQARFNEQYTGRLQELERIIADQAKNGAEAINWERLAEEDPGSYATKKLQFQEKEQQRQAIQQERERIQQQQARQERQRYLAEQNRLLQDKMPELFASEEAGKNFHRDVSAYLEGHGFSSQEINEISDHRYFQILKDATSYRQQKAETKQKVAKIEKKKVKPVPKYQKPSAPVSRTVTDLRAAANAHREHGDIDSAVALLRARRK